VGNATAWFDRTLHPKGGKNWNDELFRQRILAMIRPEHIVLDLGMHGQGPCTVTPSMTQHGIHRRVCRGVSGLSNA
jgi:hypothetical protein